MLIRNWLPLCQQSIKMYSYLWRLNYHWWRMWRQEWCFKRWMLKKLLSWKRMELHTHISFCLYFNLWRLHYSWTWRMWFRQKPVWCWMYHWLCYKQNIYNMSRNNLTSRLNLNRTLISQFFSSNSHFIQFSHMSWTLIICDGSWDLILKELCNYY